MSETRHIIGLKWARIGITPNFSPERSSGAKLAGLRYERALARALGSSWAHGRWFEFEDSQGYGMCQPDFLRPYRGELLVLECKLTDVPQAKEQLSWLYGPVLRRVYGLPVRGIIVAQNMTPTSTNVVSSLEEALASSGLPTLHVPWPKRFVGHLQEDKPTSTRRALFAGASS